MLQLAESKYREHVSVDVEVVRERWFLEDEMMGSANVCRRRYSFEAPMAKIDGVMHVLAVSNIFRKNSSTRESTSKGSDINIEDIIL